MIPTVMSVADPGVAAAVHDALETGQTIIFPTDGIGGNPWDDAVVAKVRALKGRSADQPFTLHVASVADVSRYAHVAERIRSAVNELLPGPYTLILPARPEAPACSVTADTVGIRVPRHAFFASIMASLGAPLFGTSVNAHGEDPLSDVDQMIDRFPSVDLVILGDVGGSPSDIIDLCATPPRALRGRLPASLWTSPAGDGA
jgi:tRNA threonylcarbamoyl adenosine modification protein (Sua5/YciO/YrdC/YwlC family)